MSATAERVAAQGAILPEPFDPRLAGQIVMMG